MMKWHFSVWDTSFIFRICKTEFTCEYNKAWIDYNTIIGFLDEYSIKRCPLLRLFLKLKIIVVGKLRSEQIYDKILSKVVVKLSEFNL